MTDPDRCTSSPETGCYSVPFMAFSRLGHGPTRVPEVLAPHTASDRVLLNPWDAHEMEHVASSSERVLLVGTGLTMCDAAISLARLGFSGKSRRSRVTVCFPSLTDRASRRL